MLLGQPDQGQDGELSGRARISGQTSLVISHAQLHEAIVQSDADQPGRKLGVLAKLAQILKGFQEALPEVLKISFEERADYQYWVLGADYSEKNPVQEEDDMDILQKLNSISKELLAQSNFLGPGTAAIDQPI